jgi:glucose 1-dehydrogenase
MSPKKSVIITGAAQGIGFATAQKFAQAGYQIVLNDIDEELLTIAVKKLNTDFPDACMACAGDVSDIAFLDVLVNKALASYGKINALVANAGMTAFGDFFSFLPEDFEKVVNLNLKGTFFLVQKTAIAMKDDGGGSIVLMSSVVGHQAHQHLAAYAMSKAGIEMLAKNLVIDLSPFGIRINCVAPGATLTERTLEDDAYKDTWSRITPLGKPASIQDIAETVYFLSSEQAGHITGQSLVVDGGWTSVGVSPF